MEVTEPITLFLSSRSARMLIELPDAESQYTTTTSRPIVHPKANSPIARTPLFGGEEVGTQVRFWAVIANCEEAGSDVSIGISRSSQRLSLNFLLSGIILRATCLHHVVIWMRLSSASAIRDLGSFRRAHAHPRHSPRSCHASQATRRRPWCDDSAAVVGALVLWCHAYLLLLHSQTLK